MYCSIKGVKVPIVILHALDDGIVPYELGHKVLCIVMLWSVFVVVVKPVLRCSFCFSILQDTYL